MLASVGVFASDGLGKFSLTPVGQLLQEGPGSLRAMTIHLGERPTWQAWGSLLESVTTGETAFPLAHGKEVFPYYAEHPESSEPFNQAMTEYSAAVVSAVMRAYDFSRHSHIVDIGGGHGFLLSAMLKANPRAKGVLFDIPATAEEAKVEIQAQGLASRCEVVGGNFFESVPEGGDAYVMKSIIHDWDDERAITILKNINKAMRSDGRIFLIETVVPECNRPDFSMLSDVHMMVMTGGCERTTNEYSALFQKSGFALVRVVRTDSAFSVIEGVKI
jgi:cyclopropane fatty-acyl-phospholipid synthase-like methyltransferase